MAQTSQIYFVETRAGEQRQLLCHWVEHFYEAGRRVQVVADSTTAAQHLDQMLWSFSPGSFVPHRIFMPHRAHALAERVIITVGEVFVGGFEVLVCDGPVEIEFMKSYPFAVHFILMDDSERRQQSRMLWQSLREQSLQVTHVAYASNTKPPT